MIDLIPGGDPPDPDLATASPALLGRRARAILIDVVVCYVFIETVPLSFLIWSIPDWTTAQTIALVGWSVVLFVPVYLTYSFAFEWRFGQTPGKYNQGLVVTTPREAHPSASECALRNLLRYVDFLPVGFILGYVVARRSPSGQRFGDKVAGTVVVRAAGTRSGS